MKKSVCFIYYIFLCQAKFDISKHIFFNLLHKNLINPDPEFFVKPHIYNIYVGADVTFWPYMLH